MRGVAILACFSGVLWGMPASAEELSVPADYQGRQIQIRADFSALTGAVCPTPRSVSGWRNSSIS